MKNIPHDYYLRFLDPAVYDRVLDFHVKGNYTIHEAFQGRTCLHLLNERDLSILTGNELKLYPDLDLTVDIMSGDGSFFQRNESCDMFPARDLEFDLVEKLMLPLLSKQKHPYKRGYPSAGALYPIEIFLCLLNGQSFGWPCVDKALHLLPHTCKFEVMQHGGERNALKSAVLASSSAIGSPSLAVIYVAYLPKTLFKYRYRGYRMALMEVGSIYMLVELQAKSLGLVCRLWSAYTDTMICQALGLNPSLFFPMCVHFIGKPDEADE